MLSDVKESINLMLMKLIPVATRFDKHHDFFLIKKIGYF